MAEELVNLSLAVKQLLEQGQFKKGEETICYAMYLHPHAPEPHNLMGILLEAQSLHTEAMKHFRAALDLDPTYEPARCNLMTFCAFDLKKKTMCFTMEEAMKAQ